MARVPILFFAANPRGTPPLAIGDELRAIQAKIRASEYRDTLRLIPWLSAQPDDLVQGLNEVRPYIVHFSGHGDESGQLAMHDPDGNCLAVSETAMEALFQALKGDIQIVVLNACYSDVQARAIANHIDCVVGMSAALGDESARTFAAAFYRALGFGCSVQNAYEQALSSMQLGGWGGQHVPRLIVREGVDADEVIPVSVDQDDCLEHLPEVPRSDLPEQPFCYLEPVDERHAELFFGRNRQIRDLYECIADNHSRPLILVFGQSGVGKSSLLLGGIKPRLSHAYEVVYTRRDPQRGLYGTLLDAVDGDWFEFEERADRAAIVILDQAEEAFTRPLSGRSPEVEIEEFVAHAAALFGLSAMRPRGRLVLSFRKEWLPEIDRGLQNAELPSRKLFIERLGKEGIRQVVRGIHSSPRLRKAFPITIEPDLDLAIANDLIADQDSPVAPTLSILMARLWREANRAVPGAPILSHDLYQQLKREGLHLGAFLDRQLRALSAMHREHVESGLVLDLLERHTTALGTARQWRRVDLHAEYSHVPPHLIDSIVTSLKRHYLVVEPRAVAGESLSRGLTRLAHDTLALVVREAFRASERPGQIARHILENRSAERRSGAGSAAMSEQTTAMVQRGLGGMRRVRPLEKQILDEARRAIAQRQATILAQRCARQRRNALLAAISVAVVVLAWMSHAILQDKKESDRRAELADKHKRDTMRMRAVDDMNDDPTSQLLLLRDVEEPERIPEWTDYAHRVLNHRVAHAVFSSQNGPLARAAMSADGSRLLTATKNGTVLIWHIENSHGKSVPLPVHDGAIGTAALSRDGNTVLTASEDNITRLWSVDGRLPPIKLPIGEQPIIRAAFSRDSTLVATGSKHGTVMVWRIDGTRVQTWSTPDSAQVNALAFSPDGQYVLSASKNLVRVWSMEGDGKWILRGHTRRVYSAQFSPDGSHIITSSADRTVRLWRRDGQDSPRTLCRHKKAVIDAQFSPDGTRVLTASGDGTARIARIGAADTCRVIAKHGVKVDLARFSASGTRVVTASQHGIARVQSVRGNSDVPDEVLSGHDGAIIAAGFSRDGNTLITASIDGTVRIWWLGQASRLKHRTVVLRGHRSAVSAAAFSPDGEHVATASTDTDVRTWRADRGTLIREYTHSDAPLHSVAYSSDGQYLIAETVSGIAWCWHRSGTLTPLQLCPGGSKPSRAGFRGLPVIRRYRVARVELPGGMYVRLRGHTRKLLDVALDSTGRRAVTTSQDGTARVWTLRDPDELMAELWEATPYCLPRRKLQEILPGDKDAVERSRKRCLEMRRRHFGRTR